MGAHHTSGSDSRASQMVLMGVVLGAIAGFLLRPSVPAMGQLPLLTMVELVTVGGKGIQSFFVPLAQRSFMYVMVGGMIGGFVGWLVGQMIASSGAQQASDANRVPCPFCAEPIQARAKICRYCNRSLGTAVP